jgi:polar amino acid transport system substrate-binding protein
MNRNLLLVLMAALLALGAAFAGCAGTQESQTTPTPTTPAMTTYIVGIDGEYPPYSYVDPQGNAVGFDVDSMRWIAEKKGFKVVFQPTAWDGIIPALLAKKIDLIYSGMTITEEREQQVNFSIPYWKVNQTVAIHNDTSFTMEDFLAGTLTVGAQRGTTGQFWVEDNLIPPHGNMSPDNLVLYDSFPLVATDLQNKRIQAAIYDRPPMLDAIEGKPLHIIGEIDTHEVYGVAIRKEDTALLNTINEGITELMADPYWEELKQKYDMG